MNIRTSWFVIIICIISSMNGMEKKPAHFEDLPDPLIANIIQYATITPNEPAPFSADTLRNLSLVNQRLNGLINRKYMVRIIKDASSACNSSEVMVAGRLKLRGTKQWFMNQGYDQFKQAKKICSVIENNAKNLEPYGLTINMDKEHNLDCFMQTTQGFLIETNDYPISLYTPWGSFKLINSSSGRPLLYARFGQALIDSFSAKLYKVAQSTDTPLHYFECDKQALQDAFENKNEKTDIWKEITLEDAKQKIGTSTLVIGKSQPYESIYKSLYTIRQIEGEVVPEPRLRTDDEKEKNHGSLQLLWKVFKKLYKKEIGS